MELLKKHGLRLTPQRLELAKILEKLGPKHPSFSEICEAMKRKHSNVSRSTVLKNLNEMVGLGLISSFSYGGETRYEMNPDLHVNLVDSNGMILDLNDEEVKQLMLRLVDLVSRRAGVKTKHILVIAE
jgi:Fe2+ or Zn2+ uptake regulation protein